MYHPSLEKVLGCEVQNKLRHLYCQKSSKAPLTIHKSVHSLDQIMFPGFSISDTYTIDHIKNDCRVQWYLTLTKVAHCSQGCGHKACGFCPLPRYMVKELSDADLTQENDGNVCLVQVKLLD